MGFYVQFLLHLDSQSSHLLDMDDAGEIGTANVSGVLRFNAGTSFVLLHARLHRLSDVRRAANLSWQAHSEEQHDTSEEQRRLR